MTSFDALAPDYDADFTHTQIGQYLRTRVHQRLLTHFATGDHVLELGCGTGEDALFLAEQGVRVTATDASPAMLAVARAKTAHSELVTTQALDLTALPQNADQHHDGVFSNFGALNCLDDWGPLAAWLAERVASGGVVALGIMAPFCVWELLWHGAHLDFAVAFRRLRGSRFDGIDIHYPSVSRIQRDFAPYFEMSHLMPLGLFLPPSDVFGVIEKRPRLLRQLIALEDRFATTATLSMFADHYWIELSRK